VSYYGFDNSYMLDLIRCRQELFWRMAAVARVAGGESMRGGTPEKKASFQ
jgi:hypothetical protein